MSNDDVREHMKRCVLMSIVASLMESPTHKFPIKFFKEVFSDIVGPELFLFIVYSINKRLKMCTIDNDGNIQFLMPEPDNTTGMTIYGDLKGFLDIIHDEEKKMGLSPAGPGASSLEFAKMLNPNFNNPSMN